MLGVWQFDWQFDWQFHGVGRCGRRPVLVCTHCDGKEIPRVAGGLVFEVVAIVGFSFKNQYIGDFGSFRSGPQRAGCSHGNPKDGMQPWQRQMQVPCQPPYEG